MADLRFLISLPLPSWRPSGPLGSRPYSVALHYISGMSWLLSAICWPLSMPEFMAVCLLLYPGPLATVMEPTT